MGIYRLHIGFSSVQNLITDPALFIIFCCYFSLIIKLRAEKLWIANTRHFSKTNFVKNKIDTL